MTMIRDLGWWYWTAMALLLAVGVSGHSIGIWSAVVLCTMQVVQHHRPYT
jgi:hypothetical protein